MPVAASRPFYKVVIIAKLILVTNSYFVLLYFIIFIFKVKIFKKKYVRSEKPFKKKKN